MVEAARPDSASSLGDSWLNNDQGSTFNDADVLDDLDEASVSMSELSLGKSAGKNRPMTASSAATTWSHELAKIAAVIQTNSPNKEAAKSPSKSPHTKAVDNCSITALSRGDCPLTIRLHLSYDAMENVKIQSKVHKDFVQAAKSCVDCRPPKNAMHYAKRMRARKESAPDIDLPLAFKNGHSALSLWTMRKQVLADDHMIRNARVRVETNTPEEAMNFVRWRGKQRKVAERQLGLIDKPKRRPVRKPVGRKIDGDKWPSSEPLLRSPEKRKTPARAASAVVRTPVKAAGKGWSAGKRRPMTSLGTRQPSSTPKSMHSRPSTASSRPTSAVNEGICGAEQDGEWSRELYLKLLSGDVEHL